MHIHKTSAAVLTIHIAYAVLHLVFIFALSLSAELVFMLIRNTECELILVFYTVVRVLCSCICGSAC